MSNMKHNGRYVHAIVTVKLLSGHISKTVNASDVLQCCIF